MFNRTLTKGFLQSSNQLRAADGSGAGWVVIKAYRAPDVPAGSVTPALVRDELLACSESANREFSKILD